MKLARIEHYRCGEAINWRGGEGYTYVWVPDDMTAEALYHFVNQAANAYLEAEQEFKNTDVPYPPGYGAIISPSTPDTMTVGELKAEYEAKAKAYKEYQALVAKSRRPFAFHLCQVSGGAVQQFWESRPDGFLKVELDWGHNHGVTVEHSPTVIGDYPFPEGEEDGL